MTIANAKTTETTAHDAIEGSARVPYVEVAAGETQALIEILRDASPAARDAIVPAHLEKHTSVNLPLLWDEFWSSEMRSEADAAIKEARAIIPPFKVGEGSRKDESVD
ncbi:hypothetical protein HLH33_18725 [Gluconacetobacter diazotrophicus]|uniref:Uncharacterized protein n=1 Tax=Gluconacetobacter diazotrophicus TaxID=33996 RepID=A0A7W4I8R2_GLUDI|nr:hypothetical protein [Gluconacetobacter diazotrophicus]MBB2158300.1 hypothetical protein [Gluconacetobacter diazotrophicus]